MATHFVDPALLVPLTWPHRTTLVNTDGGWKILELCVEWQRLPNHTAALPCGEADCIVILSTGPEDPDLFGVEVQGEVAQHSGDQGAGALRMTKCLIRCLKVLLSQRKLSPLLPMQLRCQSELSEMML